MEGRRNANGDLWGNMREIVPLENLGADGRKLKWPRKKI
jgi:hypothetical protein